MPKYLNFIEPPQVLVSALSVEECAARLQSAVDSPWRIFGERPIIGRARLRRFSGPKRPASWWHNGFQTRISARFERDGAKKRIRCRFAVHPWPRWSAGIWLAGALLIGGPVFLIALVAFLAGTPLDGKDPTSTLVGLIVPPAMIGFSLGNIAFGRWLARNDRAFLVEFLCRTLEAKPATR